MQFVNLAPLMEPKLGIVAGGGELPRKLASACIDNGREFLILALEGQTNKRMIESFPYKTIRMGDVGKGIKFLRDAQVIELVFAGSIKRPSLRELKLDAWALKKAALLGLKWIGDDSILSKLIQALEGEGFSVIGPDDILSNCIASPGTYGKNFPTDEQEADIKHGLRVARVVGELDIGQAAVVQQGIVLGVEGIDGTDALIRRCAPLQRSGLGAILIKTCKPQQERRIDLPVIGVDTIKTLVQSKFSGVVIEAGRAIVLDKNELTGIADQSGVFVMAVEF